ncbi:GNAT family N-acetyltransferase [Imhoffiella purpurea]|nr:GNAT family N-acetyltransferase [Imhoffiella purpurea]
MVLGIRTTEIADADAVARCVTAVARERRFLVTTEGFSAEETRAYIRGQKASGGVHWVALDGDDLVGWCNIARETFQVSRHMGRLGIGLMPRYRGRGWGRTLMASALEDAFRHGFERVELEVFASNGAAIALYRAMGFREEGRMRRACKIDGRYDDVLVFGLLVEEWTATPVRP